MIATAALIVGIVREVMRWPSYDVRLLESLPLPVIANVIPGKHTTRKGWLTKDFHYPQSPYTADINAPIWKTQFGETKSLRQIGEETAWYFRKSIRRYSDPFSFRYLFAVLGLVFFNFGKDFLASERCASFAATGAGSDSSTCNRRRACDR